MFHASAAVLFEIFQLVQLAAAAAHTAQVHTRSCARQQAVCLDINIRSRNRRVSVSMTLTCSRNVVRTARAINRLLSLLSITISYNITNYTVCEMAPYIHITQTHTHRHTQTHTDTHTHTHTHTHTNTHRRTHAHNQTSLALCGTVKKVKLYISTCEIYL